MAWLALALERGVPGRRRGPPACAAQTGTSTCFNAWVPEDGWRHPVAQAGPVLQRPGQRPGGPVPGALRRPAAPRAADGRLDRLEETPIHPEMHLVFDGIKAGSLVRAQYTYCQGVVLGLETELAVRTVRLPLMRRGFTASSPPSTNTWRRLGAARPGGGGDGGLSSGITARYLALVATTLPLERRRRHHRTRRGLRDRAVLCASGLGQPPKQGRRGCRCRAVLGPHRRRTEWPGGGSRAESVHRSGQRLGDPRAGRTCPCNCPVGC